MKLSRNIELDEDTSKNIFSFLKENPNYLFQIPEIRISVASQRLSSVRKEDLEIYSGNIDNLQDHAIEHNILNISDKGSLIRPDWLIFPLGSINYVRNNKNKLKVLDIGPRSEAEIFLLHSIGFSDVTSVDLISYSDYVEVQDAHNMNFEDSTFDIIILGWVFAYSNENKRLAEEIVRVAKNGAYIVIGCVGEPLEEIYKILSESRVLDFVGGIPCKSSDPERPGKDKIVSRYFRVNQIHNLFNKNIDTIYFSIDRNKKDKDKDRVQLMTIFDIRK